MMNRFFKFLGSFIKPAFMSRYGLLFSAVTVYLVLSFLVRLVLTIISSDELSGNIITNLAVFIAGFIFYHIAAQTNLQFTAEKSASAKSKVSVC